MRAFVFLAVLMAGGCQWAPAAVAPQPTVAVSAHMAVADANGRTLEAVVSAWTKSDVDHVTLTLFQASNSVATLTVAKADLGAAVSLGNLTRSSSYSVVARAFTSTNIEIDDLAVNAASCTTSFTTGTNDVLDIGSLALRLMDKTFVGTGNASALTVTDGTVVDTGATGTITVRP